MQRLAAILAAGVLAGCSVTKTSSDGSAVSVSIMQLAPGDDVQSSTTTVVGIEAQPMGVDGPTARIGYVRSQRSRIPSYDEGSMIPHVAIETKIDGTNVITESLEVNESKKGLFQ